MAWELFDRDRRRTDTHGTTHRYKLGCRCADCRKTNTERNRKLREARYAQTALYGLPESVSHGRSAYRNWGCRCAVCKVANSEAGAERRTGGAA